MGNLLERLIGREKPEDMARRAIRRRYDDIRTGLVARTLLMREVDGQDLCTIYLPGGGEVKVPTMLGYSFLDKYGGRRGSIYRFNPHERALGENTIRIAVHPSVDNPAVYTEAIHVIGPDGNRKYVDWWGRRPNSSDYKLFGLPKNGNANGNRYTRYGYAPPSLEELDKTIEVRLKLPY